MRLLRLRLVLHFAGWLNVPVKVKDVFWGSQMGVKDYP
jgi:hypothetical protein